MYQFYVIEIRKEADGSYTHNVQWAYALTRNVTIACGNRAIGLVPATDDSVLMQLNMPAAEISLGHISNEQERSLLMMQDYRGQLAEGLANALTEVYTKSDVRN